MNPYSNQSCRIQLFGSLRVQQGERIITRFHTYKAGALLAFLAFHRHQSQSRETLIEMFWPEGTPERGRNNLSIALSSLRNQLEPPGISAGSVLAADRLTVGLNPATVTTDTTEFEAAMQAAAMLSSEGERAIVLQQAIALYQGELLPGYYETWIVPERQRLVEGYIQAARRLVRHFAKRGEFASALDLAQRAVNADPWREETSRDLMRLSVAAGQPSAALQHYRVLEQTLLQLQQKPSAATRHLLREIEAGLQAPEADAIPARPLTARPARESLPVPSVLPTGTITFLLTDIAGSTALWERAGGGFKSALAIHHTLLRQQFALRNGYEFKEVGDAFLVAFARADDALECALDSQRALTGQVWPAEVGGLPVRMALHTGDADLQDGDYHGLTLNRASRLLTAAHGGQILCSETTASLLQRDLSSSLHLRDLGVYRLRDLPAPERLFQVEYPDMSRRQFPAPNADAGYTSALPLTLTRFFGREREQAQLQEMLLTGDTRLVTLTGPGGTGKTRLALEVAGNLLKSFAGAVWFAPLGDLTDAGLIAGAVAEVMKLALTPHQEPLEQIIEALSHQPSLLVLDNFEQLTAQGTAIVQTLLTRVPELTCLITSRQLLMLAGERAFVLKPLPVPDGTDLLEELCLFESVQLFIDRAQAVKPDFQVTSNNAAAVAALCQKLEGIPLAIELAAARAQVFTPLQMLAQLQNRFDFLASRKRDAIERHKTLWAALEWSWHLLAPDVQRFCASLSVFRGGWTAEAAEAVCEEPLALDYLALLREASLVVVEERGEEIRFRMLETLREYLAGHLEAGEQVTLVRRYVDYFLQFAAKAALYRRSGDENHRAWLAQLETEHDNLRAALQWCKADAESTGLGLRLAAALGWFWSMRGSLREGREHLAEMLLLSEAQGQTPERANALHAAAELAQGQGDIAAAQTLYEASLAIYRELQDGAGIALLLIEIGNLATTLGDIARARSLHLEALAIARQADLKLYIVWSLNNLGVEARAEGDYSQARLLFEEALAINEEWENPAGIAGQLHNLGLTAKVQGDYTAAQAYYERSLAMYRQAGNERGGAELLRYMGNAAIAQGDYAGARSRFAESLAIEQKFGDKRQIADLLNRQGDAAAHQGDYTEARTLYEQSLAMSMEAGRKQDSAESLLGLGNLARRQGDFETARTCYREHLMISRESGDKWNLSYSLEAFMLLAAAQGQLQRVALLWGGVEALRETFGIPLSPAERADYERDLISVRSQLGEAAFAAACAEGKAMTLDLLIERV